MANVDRARGFRPAKSLLGAPMTSLVRSYPAVSGRSATNNSGDIYIGDVVEISGGNVQPMTTSGGTALGVVVAVGKDNSDTALNTDMATRYYDPDNLSKRYLAHDEDGYVGIVPAEGGLFQVQSSVDGLVQGSLADIAVTGTAARGSRTTGNSQQQLTTSVNGDCEVVELVNAPDNDGSLVDADVIVKFNKVRNDITA